MQVPYGWIQELVDVNWPPEELAERLTLAGSEAEVKRIFEGQFDNIVIGQVVELSNIEKSDHLKKAIADSGNEKIQVVCGAPNVQNGQKVILAKVGAKLQNEFEIKEVKLRGVESFGMICSERELGITDDHTGIIVLDDDAPIGMPADEYLKLNDSTIKLDLTPNRPDMMSAIGVSRDVACLTGQKLKKPIFELNEVAEKASDYIKVSIDDADACPRYAARMIKGVKIGPSPWWIKQKLLLCGIRPISNVVDITNLVMLEYGHPLHAFDYNHLGSKEILVRRAHEGEKFTTLDETEHILTPDVLLITNGKKAVAAAGVMGGLDSEISNDTTDILLESAYFDPITIRRGRLKLGIVSESSTRFEKGADPNIVPEAINRAAWLINKYAGGELLSGIVDCYPKKITPVEIEFRTERANVFLGTDIPSERIVEILRGLEFDVKGEKKLKVTVPTFRPDIEREVDLFEEVVRIVGYDSVPSAERNLGPLFTQLCADDIFRNDIRKVLTGQGFDETYGSGLADPVLMSKITNDQPQVKILNPIAEDLAVMQSSLLYSLLKSVSHNIAHRNMILQLFEIGNAFSPGNPPVESEQIGIVLSGRTDDNWYSKGDEFSFYYLKGAIDMLFSSCRIAPVSLISAKRPPYLKGCSFELKINDEIVGHAGQIESKTARFFGIKQAVYTAVLDFGKLLRNKLSEMTYQQVPRFPAAPRDLALIVDESINTGEILDEIKKVGGDLLEEVKIFDLYRAKQIGQGKKSLAFALLYRSSQKSLEGEEVIVVHNKIAEHIKQHFKADIREG
jgi:phenylalanyl-tRNA synthetase beta chain